MTLINSLAAINEYLGGCGHFLSENGVPDTVQFQQGFLSPQ